MRLPSPRMGDCQLTFVSRSAIDGARALAQHAAYRQVLEECGARVETLEADPDLPDCVFIEDTVVVLDEVAIVCQPGAESRRAETTAVESALRNDRPIERIEAPATLEGGDVLRVGRTLLVGLSSRTNAAGVERLAEIAGRRGYTVRGVPVTGCLHFKTACTALPDGRLLMNPAWIDVAAVREFHRVAVPYAEPWGANIACLEDQVLAAAAHVETADLIRRLGFPLRTVDLDEFAKAEGGVTCLSILLRP
ncbi:MAG: dimethylargininase [Planctomycetia bacterium]|nr:dimethylargininase [Planctomycetia bacterium]